MGKLFPPRILCLLFIRSLNVLSLHKNWLLAHWLIIINDDKIGCTIKIPKSGVISPARRIYVSLPSVSFLSLSLRKCWSSWSRRDEIKYVWVCLVQTVAWLPVSKPVLVVLDTGLFEFRSYFGALAYHCLRFCVCFLFVCCNIHLIVSRLIA